MKAKKQVNRLDTGGRIDRNQSVEFTFDGKKYSGYVGDTLASALLANNVVLMGRSLKYHRPRGVVTANALEPNALVEINGKGGGRTPNTRATVQLIYSGLQVSSQNRFPSLRFDVMSLNRLLSPLLVAGAYYKTFTNGGTKTWMKYEKFIRKMAGLGRAGDAVDDELYQKNHCHCDVLVVGGGVSGLTAALYQAKKGNTVILADDQPILGGRLNDTLVSKERQLVEHLIAKVQANPAIETMTQTTVFGVYDGKVFGAVERLDRQKYAQRYHQIATNDVVYATGAVERPLLFKNNDLPNIMLAEALQTYVVQYAVVPGKQIVFYTTNDSVYPLAIYLAKKQQCRVTVIDTRSVYPLAIHLAKAGVYRVDETSEQQVYPLTLQWEKAQPHRVNIVDNSDETPLAGTAKPALVEVYLKAKVIAASGHHRVRKVRIAYGDQGERQEIACDVLGMSGGLTPNVSLQCHLGHKPVYDSELDALVVAEQQDQLGVTVGSAAGVWSLADKIASAKGLAEEEIAQLRRNNLNHDGRAEIYQADRKAFVDFQHDVRSSDIQLAIQEGYATVEHTKRYTLLGMATDQGKLANFGALKLMSLIQTRPLSEVGTTTYRPPYTPITLGALVGAKTGDQLKPVQLLPSDAIHRAAGAVYTDSGLWQCPEYYPQSKEETKAQAIIREAGNARHNVGLSDISKLGKISLQGPDVAELVERLFINEMKTMVAGEIRYGLMLREDGIPYHDAVVMRLADKAYLLSVAGSQSAEVLRHIEYHAQVVWPDLHVIVNSETNQWASISVVGPKSREVLAKLFGNKVALDDESLAHMTFKDFTDNGLEVRLARFALSGDLGYEIMIGANYGENLWNAIMLAGEKAHIQPYGTEAMNAMRIEKGFLTQAEIDGRVTLHQLGMTHRIDKSKPDFVGKYYAENRRNDLSGEPQLIGLQAVNKTDTLTAGYHLVNEDDLGIQESQGWISSAAWSATLGEPVALGFLCDGNQRLGETVYAVSPLDNQCIAVTVVSPRFIDEKSTKTEGLSQ